MSSRGIRPAARALQRFLSAPDLSEFVGVFAHFDPRDEAGDMWRWLSYAPKRKVIAWCRRLQRAGWRLPQLPDPRRDLPWSIATADELGVSPARDRRRDGHEAQP